MAWNGRYPLIINPSARSERAKSARRFVMEHATNFIIYASESAEDAIALAQHFSGQNEPVVVAAGGDGTINAVVNGLAGSETALGILPTGTMNVFAREQGIPAADLSLAMDIIKGEHITEVDLFDVNKTPFVQMAGIGFDARIIEETTGEHKKLLGPLAYGLSAAKIFGESPPHMKITFKEGHTTEGVCVLVGNGGLYGGQFQLFGNADNTDDLLDVLVFKDKGYQAILDFFKGMASDSKPGITQDTGSIEYFQTSAMTVTSDQEVPLEIDGEYVGRNTSFHFNPAHKNKLRVVTPKEQVVNEWQESLSALAPFMPWVSV